MGEVPPAPGQRPADRYPHSERMQAEQDWEEKGIPLPDKYRRSSIPQGRPKSKTIEPDAGPQ
jgi:hypothetical protein